MTFLAQLPKTTTRPAKRVGRGYGSGKGGHTVGRGTKGQKARTTAKLIFEGTKSNKDFFRKTPMLRGKGRLKPRYGKPVIVHLSQLESFKAGSVIDEAVLVEHHLITERQAKRFGVKILFDKAISKKLELTVPASAAVVKSLGAV